MAWRTRDRRQPSHQPPEHHSGSEIRWSEIPGRLPAQVFLHGLGGTGAATFGHIAVHPALGGHRSLVIDLPGHGLSDRPVDFDYRLESFAGVIASVLASERLGHVDLVGHSLGGSIAIVLAAAYPGLARRLVNLRIPRTFIRGEHGEALADPSGLEAAGVRIVTLPDVGHSMTVDAPEAFVAAAAAAIT